MTPLRVDPMRDGPLSWRTLAIFKLIEAPFVFLLSLGWVTLLRVDPAAVIAPVVVVMVIRWFVSAAYLRSLLAPIDEWRTATKQGNDAALIAANTALRSTPTSFMRIYGSLWVIAFSLATAYVWFGMAQTAPIGLAELLPVVLMFVAIMAGGWSFAFSITDLLLTRERVALSTALARRALPISTQSSSLSTRLIALMLNYVLASASLIAAAGVTNSTAFTRYRAVSELARATNDDAARVLAGLAPELGQIIETAALPAIRPDTGLDDLPEQGDARVTLDRRRAHVSVATPLDEGHWLLAEAPLSRQDGDYWTILLVFSVVLLLWGPITAILTTRSLIDPLRHIESAMRRLVEVGDLRELEHLTIVQDDDIGALTRSFNRLLDNLRGLSVAAHQVAAGDLTTLIDQPGELSDAFRSMLEHLDNMVVEIRKTAVDVLTASAEIHAAAQGQEAAAAENSLGASEISSAMGSLAQSAERITHKANAVLDNAVRTLATTDAMAAKIDQLDARTRGISELLEVIREIAKRSDLLALNGSLEATRAGDAGRGFALVAAEMRRLAERVTGTVADVRDQIAGIESSSMITISATKDTRTLANDTATAAREIFVTTQKQSSDTGQVSVTVQSLAEFVASASAATSQTRAAAEGLRLRVQDLARLTQRFQLRTGKDREVELDASPDRDRRSLIHPPRAPF